MESKCGDLKVHHTAPVQLPPEYRGLNSLDENVDLNKLEQRTRGQADCNEWIEARKCRLTSSNFGKVLCRKSTPTDKFLQNLFPVKSITAAALEYGKRNEIHAKTEFLKKYPAKHLHECGFVINREFDFLGSTPDGKICDDGDSGIIEIKCPYRARDHMIVQACAEFKDFCLEVKSDGVIGLKKSHEYYAQVQGQLMITGCGFCEFIVYTKRDLYVERIFPDTTFMKTMLTKLADFYKSFVVPFFESRQSHAQ